VDAICVAVLFGISTRYALGTHTLLGLIFWYCALAFGLQPVFGLVVDALHAPRQAAVLGCLLAASVLLLLSWPMVAISVAGIGNAGFHVGGGAVSLWLTPRKATAPGIFVAPGAFGLFVGAMIGKLGWPATGPLLAAVLVLSFLMTSVRGFSTTPLSPSPPAPLPRGERGVLLEPLRVPQAEPPARTGRRVNRGGLLLGFILFAVVVRSFVGLLVVQPWKTDVVLLSVLALAVVLGKALGGILADRWGWTRVSVGAMLAAAPFLAFGDAPPFILVPGLFLLNLAMPVMLVAIAEVLPRSPAFAFGLTSLAVLLGGLPPLLDAPATAPATVVAVMLVAALALYRGLQLLPSHDSPSRTAGVQE
jgi:FSR family fosmidomycin resistance protein-like MFS transporter